MSCTYTPSPPASRKVGNAACQADLKATYQATIKTNRGDIVINLLNSKAPCTVNSFVYLASKNFFSNTQCHRLTTSGIFVLQCGDPTGTGSGGPGYKFNDENLTGAKYPAATVAMANSGANTNGSQFFLVYKNTSLPPSYTPFGTIVGGFERHTEGGQGWHRQRKRGRPSEGEGRDRERDHQENLIGHARPGMSGPGTSWR